MAYMRYYISDLHFFHGVLNDHMDNRGFVSVEEMHEYMISQWNKKVRPNDDVIILGDVSFGKPGETQELLNRLNGRLYLIRGNHDKFVDSRGFDKECFKWIKDYEVMKDNGRRVVLSHYPICCYHGQYNNDGKGNPNAYMLYGHVHNTYDENLINNYINMVRSTELPMMGGDTRNINCEMINCFCMFSDYQPLTLDEWIEVDKKRREKMNLKCASDFKKLELSEE